MKNKKIVIIIMVVVALVGIIGFGTCLLAKEKLNADQPLDNTDDNDVSETNKEIFLSAEEAYKMLIEKYNISDYTIKQAKEENDSFYYVITNKKTGLIEMNVIVNKITQKIIENKVISVGGENNQGGISGGKIE